MKKIAFLITLTILVNFVYGQKKKDRGISYYEKALYFEQTEENNDYKLLLKNIIDVNNEVKFGLKITNQSNKFLLFEPNETKIIVGEKELDVKEKVKAIAPNKSKTQTINGKREGVDRSDTIQYVIDGLFLLDEKAPYSEIKELKIPMSRSDFSFEEINCKVSITVQKSQKMTLKFDVTNTSSEWIVIYPSRVALRMPDGNIYTSKNNKGPSAIAPNSSGKITAKWDRMPGGNKNDMQKVEMYITFNDVFFKTEKNKLETVVIESTWNEALTIEKK